MSDEEDENDDDESSDSDFDINELKNEKKNKSDRTSKKAGFEVVPQGMHSHLCMFLSCFILLNSPDHESHSAIKKHHDPRISVVLYKIAIHRYMGWIISDCVFALHLLMLMNMFLSVNKIIDFITLQTCFGIFDLILQVDLDSSNQVTTRAISFLITDVTHSML